MSALADVRRFPGSRRHPQFPRESPAAAVPRYVHEELARSEPTAFMCAEAPWWRCHRRLVADALTVRGWTVSHIGPYGAPTQHELPPFAAVEGANITYPAPQLSL